MRFIPKVSIALLILSSHAVCASELNKTNNPSDGRFSMSVGATTVILSTQMFGQH